MELLAPAGSFNQALVSIENGCDALYGGLKSWSARSRAINLSMDEYNNLIQICRQKGVKFYLTLNTLMSDEELAKIADFFNDDSVMRPDGILVGDIGLYSILKEKFSDIELHASTQFGAYSINDVQYFMKMGLKRVVLARELALDEISNIRKLTDIELEVFVYGNQCVIFSGNCLWGGLKRTGSGHKGSCIGACNDLYSNNANRLGDFYWVNNIGLYAEIKKLEEAGVDSIKIEGRVRPDNEVAEVVAKFRKALNGYEIENDYNYTGFLGGELPPDGMLNDVNPENPISAIDDIEFTEYDFMVEERGKKSYFVTGDKTRSNRFAFSLFRRDLLKNKINVRIRFGYTKQGEVYRINMLDYVRVNGTHIRYDFALEQGGRTLSKYTLKDLFFYIDGKISGNVYECKCMIPALSEVEIDEEQLNIIIEKINEDIAKTKEASAFEFDPIDDKTRDILICDSEEDICSYYDKGYRCFIYVIRTVNGLKNCLAKIDNMHDADIIFRLPYLDFTGALNNIYPLIRGRKVMITRLSQLDACEKWSFTEVYGDYSLNVWNSKSAEWLKKKGVSALVAHPEISLEQIEHIEQRSGMEMLVIGASKIPYGYTRACFAKLDLCEKKCCSGKTSLRNIYKGDVTELICDNDFGFRTVFDSDYYISSSLNVSQRKIFGLFGLNKKEKDSILKREPFAFADKYKIYTDGYDK